MAGQPLKRAQVKEARDEASALGTRFEAFKARLVRAGLNPDDYDPDGAADTPPMLDEYLPTLPLAVTRLANTGQAIEEIRVSLGFTEAQQALWVDQYVEFSEAISRARAREEAFWHAQVRNATKMGDRSQVTAITSLMQKRFMESSAVGQAASLIHVHVGQRRGQPVPKDE
jgi:hypothetical protein